ncbi:hypothetical protein CCM_04135 [Cordyceps militaris CM01]|uniref:Uncharacterized protein n=1 Tax=Cordyceps militaris (strain CM01) TaxID=983644 RepID=G3JDT7_CORMM|nr:uncharacterized protein CCM_04135 [Cordyceps militaris CM01]EGX92762.1 hypothetical protein CCM_04135 [Cordyceps militaris CM01]
MMQSGPIKLHPATPLLLQLASSHHHRHTKLIERRPVHHLSPPSPQWPVYNARSKTRSPLDLDIHFGHMNVDDLSSHADAHTRSINDQRKVGQTPQLQPRNREIYDAPRIVGFPGQSLPLVGGKEGLGGDVALLPPQAMYVRPASHRMALHHQRLAGRFEYDAERTWQKEKSHRGGQLDRRAVSPVGGEDGTPPRRKIPALFVCGCGDGIQSLDEREGGGHCGWTKDKMMDDSAACRNSRWGDKALWNYSGLVQDLVTIKKSSGCLAVHRAHKLARENHWHSQEGVRASSQHGRNRGQQELVRTDTMGKSVESETVEIANNVVQKSF